MKLEWFSPLPPCKSGIAVYTRDLAADLQKCADVRYWNFWGDEGRDLASTLAVSDWTTPVSDWSSKESWKLANDGGVPIYHFGNNGPFHWPMWQLLHHRPGIVVIHDGALLNLALSMLAHSARDRTQFIRIMQHYYGVAGVDAAASLFGGRTDSITIAPQFPFIEYILDKASAAVVHTRALFDLITRRGTIPVLFAPLPAGRNLLEIASALPTRQGFGPEIRVIVFGHLAPNRRLPSILRALAESPYRESLYLTIAGDISDEKQVISQIASLGIQRRVRIEGFVTEARLGELLSNSDIAINLRYPTMGEASHSQLHLWAYGLPTLVTKTGWYAEQPAGTVVTADPHSEIDDIKDFFARSFEQPEPLLEVGRKGRDWLRANHTPSTYAEDIADFAARVGSVPSWILGRHLSERAATAISSLRLDPNQLPFRPSLFRAIKNLAGLQ